MDALGLAQCQEDVALIAIIANGRPEKAAKTKLTSQEVVDLAYRNDPPHGPEVVITVPDIRGVHIGTLDGALRQPLPTRTRRNT